ncbi:MAG: hypothetical protein ABIS36_14725 [Chryseolinea sp.]
MKYILIGYFFSIILFVCACNISSIRAEKHSVHDNANAIAQLHDGDLVNVSGDTIYVKRENQIISYHKTQFAADTHGWVIDDSVAFSYHPGITKNFWIQLHSKIYQDESDFVAVSQNSRRK